MKTEYGELDHRKRILEAYSNNSALKLRVLEEELRDLEDKYEHREKRNQELMGKYLRLEEDYRVLEARSHSDPVSFNVPWIKLIVRRIISWRCFLRGMVEWYVPSIT